MVVLVEPSEFVLVEHILDDARGIDVAESQCVEALELALLRRVARSGIGGIDGNVEGAHEHQVLMTNAVFAAQIDGGFVGEDHTVAQHLGIVLHTN